MISPLCILFITIIWTFWLTSISFMNKLPGSRKLPVNVTMFQWGVSKRLVCLFKRQLLNSLLLLKGRHAAAAAQVLWRTHESILRLSQNEWVQNLLTESHLWKMICALLNIDGTAILTWWGQIVLIFMRLLKCTKLQSRDFFPVSSVSGVEQLHVEKYKKKPKKQQLLYIPQCMHHEEES